jgi:hypothetical protein
MFQGTLKETIKDNFVEKNMLIKNLKYLELQTKQLIEESKKKTEKPESWILAKKPYNGHLCASCEAYLGDLKPNTNSKYIAWNKYPAKEPIDKIFRINAGFSKVLQMVHQDNKNDRSKSNSLNNSKDERCNSSPEGDKKRNTQRIQENKIGISSRGARDRNKHNNSSTQIEDNDMGNLPRIESHKKTLNTSSIFIYDSSNTNRTKTIHKKSRSLVNINDNENKIKDSDETDNLNNKELQKPKITKVFRKYGETPDKKEDKEKI